jgi:hypothetical protein
MIDSLEAERAFRIAAAEFGVDLPDESLLTECSIAAKSMAGGAGKSARMSFTRTAFLRDRRQAQS